MRGLGDHGFPIGFAPNMKDELWVKGVSRYPFLLAAMRFVYIW